MQSTCWMYRSLLTIVIACKQLHPQVEWMNEEEEEDSFIDMKLVNRSSDRSISNHILYVCLAYTISANSSKYKIKHSTNTHSLSHPVYLYWHYVCKSYTYIEILNGFIHCSPLPMCRLDCIYAFVLNKNEKKNVVCWKAVVAGKTQTSSRLSRCTFVRWGSVSTLCCVCFVVPQLCTISIDMQFGINVCLYTATQISTHRHTLWDVCSVYAVVQCKTFSVNFDEKRRKRMNEWMNEK